MGLQNQLSDVSSESILILMVVLIGKSARYLHSVFFTILRFFSPRFDSDNADVDGDCVVCLNQLVGGDLVRKLSCRHVFHKDCFDGWLHHLNFNCPLCRSPVVPFERVKTTRRRVAGDVLGWFTFH
ncbi:E3 ubiquitin- ligase RHA2A-like [Olea europaea subsp. europaea]|uniref:E3 ubiquitin- ligase RHA2A-like n=1 Tax=Olea europaea subsp. europaea TaxID=158383 RepID=A0A8S0QCZ1_OLEEU|nr:E3 ubiquitin- ligase RHA2A-like [Olea europaea subsp. europaea]